MKEMRDRANFAGNLFREDGSVGNGFGSRGVEGTRLRLDDADVHADRGQQLSHAVVQLAGNAFTLLVFQVLETRCQFYLLPLRPEIGDQNTGCRLLPGQHAERKIGGNETAVGKTHMQIAFARPELGLMLQSLEGRLIGWVKQVFELSADDSVAWHAQKLGQTEITVHDAGADRKSV